MEWAVLNEVEASDPPADGSWRNFTCRAPRSFNVDVGRNSTALIEEYKAGWRTLEGICGEMGEDWVQTLKQRAREMARAAAIEQEFGVLPGSLIAAQLETMQHAANQTQAVPVEQP
jgi:capsid protein